MPQMGFGTWEITPDSAAESSVQAALTAGYRHIDTAKIYGNERGVGKAIRESGVPREDVFVTTKLWNSDHAFDSALHAIDESLAKLGLEYVDLYLVHWPQSDARDEAWRAMQEIYKSGKAKAVGVSNYSMRHLQELLDNTALVPHVNQVEFHPFIYQQQKELLEFCAQHSILVEAYSPLSRHAKTSHPEIERVAERVGKSPTQVILRWCIQHGTAPLPRSQNPEHIVENFSVFDFELNDDDMAALDGLSEGERVTTDLE